MWPVPRREHDSSRKCEDVSGETPEFTGSRGFAENARTLCVQTRHCYERWIWLLISERDTAINGSRSTRDTVINGCSSKRDTAINGFSLERRTAPLLSSVCRLFPPPPSPRPFFAPPRPRSGRTGATSMTSMQAEKHRGHAGSDASRFRVENGKWKRRRSPQAEKHRDRAVAKLVQLV